jgi:hypothetical protein
MKLIAILVLFLVNYSDTIITCKTLIDNGYHSIVLHGYSLYNCPPNFLYHTKFSALDKYFNEVSGVVCSGNSPPLIVLSINN